MSEIDQVKTPGSIYWQRRYAKAAKRIEELEAVRQAHVDEIVEVRADNERLRAAACKTLKEQDESDDHHSAACINWSFLEHSQHQCGLCDLREALKGVDETPEVDYTHYSLDEGL